MGRATQGVRLINIRENDLIASVAYVEVNEEDGQNDADNSEQSEEAAE
jgi:hypothetical protein